GHCLGTLQRPGTAKSRRGSGQVSQKKPANPPPPTGVPQPDHLLWPDSGPCPRTENRLHSAAPMPPLLNGEGLRRDDRHALAVFCYAEPGCPLGEHVAQTATALARRQTPVHLFSRHDFGLALPGVSVCPVGGRPHEDLIESVQEFARRACNAFLSQFDAGCPNVTLMGYEWSSVPALSVLCGIKNVKAILSIQSLERQRSDMTG